VMNSAAAARDLRHRLAEAAVPTEVLSGPEALEQVCVADEVDTVMAAIVGGAGLLPTLAAARAGKKLLLANKEALVMAGALFMEAVRQSSAILLPIDSEHNAIFQCLPINTSGQFVVNDGVGFDKIMLTASGGPFLHTPVEVLADVTPAMACVHPNWKLGPKISVDSATMMNKSLELIEASLLIATAEDRIDIVIHPQSIVHSMVYYRDGSVLAQLGNPDMRTPIAHGLAWPQRIASGVASLDLVACGNLEFLAPDPVRFPCLRLGRQAAREQGTAPVILNAANEVAVQAFLDKRLSFTEIPVIIEDCLNRHASIAMSSMDVVLEEDARIREQAEKLVNRQAA
ncbi:MAG: 1-deoxy-D-xylulose-5-phosphate reductoisomerase, partial [Pseudohongiellaceae bacterium]